MGPKALLCAARRLFVQICSTEECRNKEGFREIRKSWFVALKAKNEGAFGLARLLPYTRKRKEGKDEAHSILGGRSLSLDVGRGKQPNQEKKRSAQFACSLFFYPLYVRHLLCGFLFSFPPKTATNEEKGEEMKNKEEKGKQDDDMAPRDLIASRYVCSAVL